jgi:pSer/pThr/pTyr-binding forkhead associated (FHA) protein
MPAYLVATTEPIRGQVVPLEKAILVVGRQADCDIILTQSRKVSRKHCIFAQVNDRWMLRDLGSTNGVSVNGTRVKKEARLRNGDLVTIGDLPFRLQNKPELDEPAAEKVVAPRVDSSPIAVALPDDLPENAAELSLEVPIALSEPMEHFPPPSLMQTEPPPVRKKPDVNKETTDRPIVMAPTTPVHEVRDEDDLPDIFKLAPD